MRLLALLGPFTDHNDRFPTLSYISSNEIHTLSYFWNLKSDSPFRVGPPRTGPNREYPQGEKPSGNEKHYP